MRLYGNRLISRPQLRQIELFGNRYGSSLAVYAAPRDIAAAYLLAVSIDRLAEDPAEAFPLYRFGRYHEIVVEEGRSLICDGDFRHEEGCPLREKTGIVETDVVEKLHTGRFEVLQVGGVIHVPVHIDFVAAYPQRIVVCHAPMVPHFVEERQLYEWIPAGID